MTKKNDQSAILRDTAVFDYVAGNLSQGAQQNFEKKLANDPLLQKEVQFERELKGIIDADASADKAPVSMGNFDALLEKIDQAETTTTNKTFKFGLRQLSIAASFAAVCAISVGFLSDLYEPKFVTLSAPERAQNADFVTLVEQQRLAKLVLTEPENAELTQQLLAGYQLDSLDSTPQQGAIIVKAGQVIDSQKLAMLRADKRVVSVVLIEFGGKE